MEAEEGEKMITEFVSRAEKLIEGHKRGELSREEVQRELDAMKKDVMSSENSYIQNILASAISE